MLKLAIIADQESLQSFISFFKKQKNKIENLISQKIKINYIYNNDSELKIDNKLQNSYSIKSTNDFNQIIADKNIDIILELNKNINSLTYITKALKNDKIFISNNIKVIAENYSKIKKLEKKYQNKIYFSASFSPLPIQSLINNFYALDEITEVNAILNATTNYILTEMKENKVSMKETITQAQKLSYTEKDPELDLNGFNSLYKLILMTNLLFDTALDLDKIKLKGIKGITSYDLIYAAELGYEIKLITSIKKTANNLYLGVRPNLIKNNSFLAAVNENSNAVEIFSKLNAKTTFKAENNDLAFANLLSLDIIKAAEFIANKKNTSSFSKSEFEVFDLYTSQKNSFYIRLQLEKNDEIIKKIKKIFSAKNIADLILHDNLTETPLLPVIIITKEIKEKKLEKILQEVEKLDGVLTVNNIIPVRQNTL